MASNNYEYRVTGPVGKLNGGPNNMLRNQALLVSFGQATTCEQWWVSSAQGVIQSQTNSTSIFESYPRSSSTSSTHLPSAPHDSYISQGLPQRPLLYCPLHAPHADLPRSTEALSSASFSSAHPTGTTSVYHSDLPRQLTGLIPWMSNQRISGGLPSVLVTKGR